MSADQQRQQQPDADAAEELDTPSFAADQEAGASDERLGGEDQCLFCAGAGSEATCGHPRAIVLRGRTACVHHLCALWAPAVYQEEVGAAPGLVMASCCLWCAELAAEVALGQTLQSLNLLSRAGCPRHLHQPRVGVPARPQPGLQQVPPPRRRRALRPARVRTAAPPTLPVLPATCLQHACTGCWQSPPAQTPLNVARSLTTDQLANCASVLLTGAPTPTTSLARCERPTWCWSQRPSSCGAQTMPTWMPTTKTSAPRSSAGPAARRPAATAAACGRALTPRAPAPTGSAGTTSPGSRWSPPGGASRRRCTLHVSGQGGVPGGALMGVWMQGWACLGANWVQGTWDDGCTRRTPGVPCNPDTSPQCHQ